MWMYVRIHTLNTHRKTDMLQLHVHDCELCKFLGTYRGADLWYHESQDTCIARFSDDGPDYCSYEGWCTTKNEHILEARRRVASNGWVQVEVKRTGR